MNEQLYDEATPNFPVARRRFLGLLAGGCLLPGLGLSAQASGVLSRQTPRGRKLI